MATESRDYAPNHAIWHAVSGSLEGLDELVDGDVESWSVGQFEEYISVVHRGKRRLFSVKLTEKR